MMTSPTTIEIMAQYRESGHVRGCPIGSVGAEIATQSEEIREAVCDAFEEMICVTEDLVERAVEEGDLDPATEARAFAQMLLAYLQGATLLAKSKNDPNVMQELKLGYLQLLELAPTQSQRGRSS